MSRPRREWWSLRCSRRWPVRSLMRWVSSATWTRVLPVSCSFSPNWAMISRLRSRVSVMRQRRVAGSSCDRPSLVDVPAHLLDERLDRVEALLAAQPFEELEAQRLAVDVGVEVEQERLDELAPPGHEHRPNPDVRGGRVRAAGGDRRAARVHAVAGRDEPVGGQQVRRGEAELAPALVAVDDLARDRERRAEELVGVLDRAPEDEPADVARGGGPGGGPPPRADHGPRSRPPAAARHGSRSARPRRGGRRRPRRRGRSGSSLPPPRASPPAAARG